MSIPITNKFTIGVSLLLNNSTNTKNINNALPRRVGLVVSVTASHAVGRPFAPRSGHTKDHHKMVQTASLLGTQALGYEFDSAARLSKRPGSVWNCLWRHASKRSPWINSKSRVLYPSIGFISNATWPLMPKKDYNGLIIILKHCL